MNWKQTKVVYLISLQVAVTVQPLLFNDSRNDKSRQWLTQAVSLTHLLCLPVVHPRRRVYSGT
jgi:hypothetical protein